MWGPSSVSHRHHRLMGHGGCGHPGSKQEKSVEVGKECRCGGSDNVKNRSCGGFGVNKDDSKIEFSNNNNVCSGANGSGGANSSGGANGSGGANSSGGENVSGGVNGSTDSSATAARSGDGSKDEHQQEKQQQQQQQQQEAAQR